MNVQGISESRYTLGSWCVPILDLILTTTKAFYFSDWLFQYCLGFLLDRSQPLHFDELTP